LMQNSSLPNGSGASATSGASVKAQARRKFEPNSRWINEPCLPSSPNPRFDRWRDQ
jgi:hypothetical protein